MDAARVVEVRVPGKRRVVSVTIVETVDTGYTSFSLLVPGVDLPTDQSSVFMHTEGITTVHRIRRADRLPAERDVHGETWLMSYP